MTTSIDLSTESSTVKTDFTTYFSPGIRLNPEKQYEVALKKGAMYYSWANISASQGNNVFEYSSDSGTTWDTVTFDDGLYTIDEINGVIPPEVQVTGINATQRVKVTLQTGYQVRFTATKIHSLLGFNSTDVLTLPSTVSPNKADLTNGIQSIIIHCSLVDTQASYSNGRVSNVLYTVSPPSLPPGSLYNVVEPDGHYYLPMNTTYISDIRMWLTDQRGLPINNLNEDSSFHLLIREVK